MSIETVMDKAHLAAFADGQLTPEDAAKVVIHLADHPQDQAYVDEVMAANEALLQAFSAPMDEPVPTAIEEAIMGKPAMAKVIPFRRPAVWAGGMALAASAALALIAVPHLTTPAKGHLALSPGPVAEDSALAQRLNTLPSGTPEELGEDLEVMILATLPVENGYCREVEIVDQAAARIDLGIACHDGAGWSVAMTISEPLEATGTEDGFVAASGAEVQSLQPFLDRLGAGVALDAATEAETIAQGWQP